MRPAPRLPKMTMPTVAGPEDWRTRAACAAPWVDPELFYANDPGELAEAKAICHACRVKSECLDEFMDDAFGMFAGLTPDERKNKRRRENRASQARVAS